MNEETKAKLEEMADGYTESEAGKRYRYTINAAAYDGFMAGSAAAWDLATKPSEDDEKEAVKYARRFGVAVPLNEEEREMNKEIVEHISAHFLAGRQGLRAAVQAAVEKELMAVIAGVEREISYRQHLEDQGYGNERSHPITACREIISYINARIRSLNPTEGEKL